MKQERKRPMICLVVNARTLDEFKTELETYGQDAQLIQWRADAGAGLTQFSADEFSQYLKLMKAMCHGRTFIFEYIDDNENEVNKYLRSAMGAVDYIDIDTKNTQAKYLMREAHRRKTKVVFSYHEMSRILKNEEIAMELIRMEKYPADVLNIVAFANSEEDAYAVLEGAYSYNQLRGHKPFCAAAMGEEGQASRICGGDFGCVWTYACGSRQTEPGQFNVPDLKRYMDNYYR